MTRLASARASKKAGHSALLLRRIEAMGIRTTEAHWSLLPETLALRCGARVVQMDDGLSTLMATSDALRMNRVIGLGHLGRASERTVERIIGHYRSAGVGRFSLQLGPGPQHEAISGWLSKRGFVPKEGLSLLVRDCRTPIAREHSGVTVARAAAVDRPTILRIQATCFAAPASRRAWSLASLASGGQEHFLAFAGATPIGVGTLRVDGDLAWLGAGCTLTRWRRRGAHRALIRARLKRAASLGCRWAWVETSEPLRGRPGGSRRNLLRLGFEEAWIKPMFVWRSR